MESISCSFLGDGQFNLLTFIWQRVTHAQRLGIYVKSRVVTQPLVIYWLVGKTN